LRIEMPGLSVLGSGELVLCQEVLHVLKVLHHPR
jgi:hypothetical protein